MISVVIPSASDALLSECLESLERSEPGWIAQHEVIVVDDGIGEAVKRRFTDVKFVPGVKPFIFARNVNIGFRAASGHPMVMNDDVTVCSPRFLSSLESVLVSAYEYGMISPRIIRNVGNPDQMHTTERLRETEQTLCMVAVVIRREAWRQIGELDERFTGYGFEDDDYSLRATMAGWKRGVTGLAVVDHRIHGTFGKFSREELLRAFGRNKRLFVEKWGRETLLKYRLWGEGHPHLDRKLG